MAGEKSLRSKAVNIQGKKYVLVADRVIYFNENYPKGQITTELLSPVADVGVAGKTIVVRATVQPDTGRTFTGYSQAVVGAGYINKTSALENAETSAVGRALAMLGIGVIDSVASVDEIGKAKAQQGTDEPFPTRNPNRKPLPPRPTDYISMINSAKTIDALEQVGKAIADDTTITAIKKDALRPMYDNKHQLLAHASESPKAPTA